MSDCFGNRSARRADLLLPLISYDIFAINIVSAMLGYLYGACESTILVTRTIVHVSY